MFIICKYSVLCVKCLDTNLPRVDSVLLSPLNGNELAPVSG